MPSGVQGAFVWNKTVELTDSQIKGLPTQGTWVDLLPAPGATSWYVVLGWFASKKSGTDPFWDTGYASVSGDYPASGYGLFYETGEIASTFGDFNVFKGTGPYLYAAGSAITVGSFATPQISDGSNLLNQKLQIGAYNTAGNYTGGNAANILMVTVFYSIISLF
jgi:hypothetical protein